MRFILLFALSSALAAGATPKSIASYDIQASLDTGAHLLTGKETLTWLNDSKDTVPTLQFHLYMNAFKNTRSTFFRESGGQLRGDEFKGDEWGWIQVDKIRLGAADLTGGMRFIHPDLDHPDDQTVLEVPLSQPVKPGETIQVEIQFRTRFPKVFARTGFHKDFYMGGQWFPKLGVWETAGFRYSTQGAWNCHQFHANSEFFANFGQYRVQLTVPDNEVVGATGELKSKSDNPKNHTSTYTFEQANVTDFAWTVQPTFIREERMFVASNETTPAEIAAVAKLHGISEQDAKLTDVKMIALVQPEHREQMERHFQSLRTAIKWFGLWYGNYPYKTITVVDPPYGAGGAGGMEYPTFITAGTSWRLPPEARFLEEVVIHEFGHQFWMELVATNEFEESPLDEGFNTFSTGKIMDQVYGGVGQLPITFLGINVWKLFHLPMVSDDSLNRAQYLLMPVADDLLRKSWEYYNGNSYGINSYARMGVTMRTMEGVLGADTVSRIMRSYHQKWRFAHPTARDFQQTANEVSGSNLDWFFDQFFFGNRLLDYRTGDVIVREQHTPIGVFDRGGKPVTTTRDAGRKQDAKNNDNKQFKKTYECIVKLQRIGDAQVPQEIAIHFSDGSVEKRTWDGKYRWVKYTFLKQAKVDRVEVDPQRKYLLDVDFANNSWQEKYNIEVSTHWSANLLFWLQNIGLYLSALV